MSPRRANRAGEPVHRLVYWDSCLFIAWLTGEQRRQVEIDGLREAVEHAKRGTVTIVISAAFEIEVLDATLSNDARTALTRFLRQGNVEVIGMEPPIIRLASAIRNHYVARKAGGTARFVPSFPDSVHLATAINRRVDAFYTFDRGGKDKGNLLALDGDVAGHSLVICLPPVSQLTLGFSQ